MTRNTHCPLLVKMGLGLWICVVLNIIIQTAYLHFYIPGTPSKSEPHEARQSVSSMSQLKQFYSAVNRNNTYLNPNNVNNESVVYQLLRRILTQNSDDQSQLPLIESIISRFKFSLQPLSALCKSSDIEFGCYKVTQKHTNGEILIEGNSIPSITSGLSYFLATHWMVSISWNGDNMDCLLDEDYLTLVMENTPHPLSIYASRTFEYTYYKNPCTDSYSMVWWDWDRWEKELDWMALQNINLLLLPTLNELIEYELYTAHYGLSVDELTTYFVGPAFLAWFRMGNLRGWPPYYTSDEHRLLSMTPGWLQQQLILSYRIIARCIELGIDLILPGFSGHVPTAFTHYVKGDFYDGSRWFGMPNELTHLKFLDPTDELFVTVGLEYQRIQYDIISSFLAIKRSNTIFLWLDQFNELTPKSDKLEYLKKSGENQLRSLQLKEYSSKIKWTIQGWMFVHMRRYWSNDKIQHYLGGIGGDDILILDLIAEKGSIAKNSDYFFGHNYIWCFLHNFGGGAGLSGNLQNIFDTLSNHSRNEHWRGIGISMEGIHNNPMLYHAVLYHSFKVENEANTMDVFVAKYISSRYGKVIFNAQILDMWKALHELIYNSVQGKWSVTKSLIVKRPSQGIVSGVSEFDSNYIAGKTASGFQTTLVDYPVCKLFLIWERFVMFAQESRDKVLQSKTFANDIAEITRQLLSDMFQQMFLLWRVNESRRLEEVMLGIIDDIDATLSDFKYFRLDEWIQNARMFGDSKEEKDYFEWNARNLITRWGPNAEINDYASRQWNGLMSNYYKIRWMRFFNRKDHVNFEKQWQKQTIASLQNTNQNNYQTNGDFDSFYDKIFDIHRKYKGIINCTIA
eukprot:11370_1